MSVHPVLGESKYTFASECLDADQHLYGHFKPLGSGPPLVELLKLVLFALLHELCPSPHQIDPVQSGEVGVSAFFEQARPFLGQAALLNHTFGMDAALGTGKPGEAHSYDAGRASDDRCDPLPSHQRIVSFNTCPGWQLSLNAEAGATETNLIAQATLVAAQQSTTSLARSAKVSIHGDPSAVVLDTQTVRAPADTHRAGCG
ncbi:MAG: hypothetical protein JWL97_4389 [Gemmatimonadales bacterium]|nr:hypothetical protein [Gemmatimonadales bacterium]